MPEPDAVFAALADPTRRDIVRALAAGAERPSELAERLGLTRPTMSRHLRVLHEAALVEVSLDAEDHRVRRYALRREGFQGAQAFLAEVEAFWEDQLAAFQAFVEQR
ncbi:MAG: helix-turn-helix transcriptional regulator [Alphaproteobacteria bacterium]|nr:helix-turn-helix transcriptional regulator [Alphaproteobacteria bacterium]MCB9791557.1 helix-turn-helix transcriptional regulator [Alphaproteobacteria bacterium]